MSKASLDIDYLRIATSQFTLHVQEKGKETSVSLLRNNLTLNYFLENNSNVWDSLTNKFSSFVEYGKDQILHHGQWISEDDEDLSHKATTNDAASTLAFSNQDMETQQALRNFNTTPVAAPDQTNDAASALVFLGRSEPIPFKQDTVASVPLVMEEKYQQLRCQLVKMKK
jgi:hypothetical protein